MAATAILLIVTAGLAEAIVYYRARAVSVQLGPVRQFPEGQIDVRLPDGWSSIPLADCPPGTVVGLEGTDNRGRGRRLFVFRGFPISDLVPSLGGLNAIHRAAKPMGHEVMVREEIGSGQVAGLPGATALAVPRQLLSAGDLPFCLGQAAVGPGGEVVGVLLSTPTLPARSDRALLNEIAGSLRLQSLEVDVDPTQAMSAAGISFDRPAGVKFIGPTEATIPRVRMMGGQDQTAWYLDVYRVPLVRGREPANLVEDAALSCLRHVRLAHPPELFSAGQRSGARISVGEDGREPSIHILAVRTDAQTALFMKGLFETAAAVNLRDLCLNIAETAQVLSFENIINIESGLEAGRRQIEESRRQGFGRWLRQMEGKTRHFAVKSPMMDLGTLIDAFRRRQEGGQTRWEIASRWTFKPPWGTEDGIVMTEAWSLAEDGVSYQYEFQHFEDRERILRQTESRQGEGRPVSRVVDGLHGSRRDTIAADASYVTDVLLTQIASGVSRDVPPRPLILCGVKAFTTGTAYLVLTPVGKLPLPGSGAGDRAWAVRTMTDYDPDPVCMFFDDEGGLLAILSDGGQWQERTEVPALESDETGVGGRRKR